MAAPGWEWPIRKSAVQVTEHFFLTNFLPPTPGQLLAPSLPHHTTAILHGYPSGFYHNLLTTMGKGHAQWDDRKDLFVIRHLLRATRQGKKSDNGFKKDVWTELQRTFNSKFGTTLDTPQFHSRGQTVNSLSLEMANSSSIKTTKSFKLLWIKVGLDGMMSRSCRLLLMRFGLPILRYLRDFSLSNVETPSCQTL